ncbi:hypothetical protein ACLKA7_009103 [Drosophila subpalustris]
MVIEAHLAHQHLAMAQNEAGETVGEKEEEKSSFCCRLLQNILQPFGSCRLPDDVDSPASYYSYFAVLSLVGRDFCLWQQHF